MDMSTSEIDVMDLDLDDPFENLSDEDPEYHPDLSESDHDSRRKKRKLTEYFHSISSSAKEDFPSTSAPNSSNSKQNLEENHEMKFSNSPMLDGKFFKVISYGEKDHVGALCQLCLPKQKEIKGSTGTTTNFVKHLKRVHKTDYAEYLKYKTEKQKNDKVLRKLCLILQQVNHTRPH